MLAAGAAPSGSRERSVSQPFDGSFRREPSISVEDLVDLAAVVSHAPPKRPQDRTRAGGLGRHCEVARSRGIEDDGQHLRLRQRSGQLGDAGDFDQLDGTADDPLQLNEPTSTTLEERERTEPHNDRHATFWADGTSVEADPRGSSLVACPARRRADQDATPSWMPASWRTSWNMRTNETNFPTGSSSSSSLGVPSLARPTRLARWTSRSRARPSPIPPFGAPVRATELARSRAVGSEAPIRSSVSHARWIVTSVAWMARARRSPTSPPRTSPPGSATATTRASTADPVRA